MRNFLLLLVLSGISVVLSSCASHQGKSKQSAIPAKREFPVNPKVDPCENFYAYACSKVDSSFKLPEDRSRHNFAFNDSSERILEAKKQYFRDLLKTPASPSTERAQTLKTVFSACMNEEASKRDEVKHVQAEVTKVAGISSRKDFAKLNAERILSGDHSMYSFSQDANTDNPDIYDILLWAPNVQRLPERSYYDNNALMKDYKRVVQKFFETLQFAEARKRAEKVVEFEKTLSQKWPLPAEFRELFTEPRYISKSEFLKRYPDLEMKRFISKIPASTKIRFITGDHWDALQNASRSEDLQTLKDVYLVHSLTPVMDDAYPDYFKARFKFHHQYLGGPAARPDREERCTTRMMEEFGRELDAELIPKMFPKFPRDRFRKLAERVRQQVVTELTENSWLSKSAKAEAIRKIRSAKLQLVSPSNAREWYFNPIAQYSELTPIENSRILQEKWVLREFDELKRPRDKNVWAMGPLTVNAYFSSDDVKFVMPIGILQPPFFDASLDDQENLGGVGTVVAHELGHGIDDKGSKYDHLGRLHQWMTKKDLDEFHRRTAFFVEQLNRACHNGKLVLGEVIGDFVGLTNSYKTAFPSGKGDASKKREFFLQYARLWCEVQRPQMVELRLKTGPHPLGIARVNEQVKHQPGFEEAFACKPGDPMTLPPEKRVRLW